MPDYNIDFFSIDRHFADFILSLSKSSSEPLWLAAALLSRALRLGDVCISLENELNSWPDALSCLKSASAWGNELEKSLPVGKPGASVPIILDEDMRLYLNRYYNYEIVIAEKINSLLKTELPLPDLEDYRNILQKYFPNEGEGIDWQKVASIAAVTKKFTIISGGPGTGKTSTVAKIIAILSDLHADKNLRIALAAPTGKAAARLAETLRTTRENLACDEEVKKLIPEEVQTIHRLLRYIRNSVRFRYNSRNLLPYDLIIIDEASMVSLPLMAKLLSAVSEDSRIIMLGDKDQLASVEAGGVFGDISYKADNSFSPQFCKLVKDLAGDELKSMADHNRTLLADSVITLEKSYRFSDKSGIGEVLPLVRRGEGEAVLDFLQTASNRDVKLIDIPSIEKLKASIKPIVLKGYGNYIQSMDPEIIMDSFSRFRILCS
ncbi:MAG: exodeoxyribonuclease V subunit alpha, partial [Desulfuromonadales bacterium]|nr:exodeoxyribonuclease V subunit alpha [Desulfuromonadales bacterium]